MQIDDRDAPPLGKAHADDPPVEELSEFVSLLGRVMRGMQALRGESDDLMRGQRLAGRHKRVLALLLSGPMTVGEIATRFEVTLTTVSGLVAELDHAGFVERRQDPADRRRTIVSIVEPQRADIETWHKSITAPFVRTLARLTPQQRDDFVAGLRALDDELRTDSTDTEPICDS
jgi:DNA-binding MarR family transcriptional regulator